MSVKHSIALLLWSMPLYTMELRQHEEKQSKKQEGLSKTLIEAIELENEEVALQLIESGAPIDPRDRFGNTVLDYAAMNGLLRVCKLLVEKKADINTANDRGRTPLSQAAQHEPDPAVCEFLLQSGALVDVKDTKERSIVYWPARRHHNDVLLHLLDWGAGVHEVDNEGKTAKQSTYSAKTRELLDFAEHGIRFSPYDHEGQERDIWLPGWDFYPLVELLPTASTMCPSKNEVNTRLACLRAALLCLSRSHLFSKEVQLHILKHASERAEDLMIVYYYDLCNGHPLSEPKMALLRNLYPGNVKEMLSTVMQKLGFGTSLMNELCRANLESYLMWRLTVLQQRAFGNLTLKENK